MPLADITTLDILWIALSVFLAFMSIGLIYVLYYLGKSLKRLTALLHGLEDEVPPVVNEVGGTVRRVNSQLDKADRVTDSAVDIADNVDTAVRAVSMAITRPVQIISSATTGLVHGASTLREKHSFEDAVEAGRDAARRRRRDLEQELKPRGESPRE